LIIIALKVNSAHINAFYIAMDIQTKYKSMHLLNSNLCVELSLNYFNILEGDGEGFSSFNSVFLKAAIPTGFDP